MEFSEKGGRLVSCDSSGSVVGWRVDSKGQTNTAFHLDLTENVTHLTFRLTVKNYPDYDVENLAKAAVNGDEHALDMFSNWRPKTTARKFRIQNGNDNLCFFVGTQIGSIYYVNNSGSCTEVLNTEGVPLTYVVYHPNKDALIVMMEGLTIGHFSVDSQGHLTELAKVKLSGRIQTRTIGSQGLTWISNSSLAILTGDLMVRVWDIESNDNYTLPTTLKMFEDNQNTNDNNNINEIFTCLAYSKLNQNLCAGTNIGRIYFWMKNLNNIDNPEDMWELNNVNTISGTIKQLMWGSVMLRLPLLSVNCVTSVYIMKEQNICTAYNENIWAIQQTANQILLQTNEKNSNQLIKLDNQVTDMAISEQFIAFTNSRTIFIHEIIWTKDRNVTIKQINTFPYDNDGILIYKSTLIVINSKNVVLRSCTGGPILHTITTNSSEGEPIGMDVTNNYLTIFTIEGCIKIYDLSECGTELKLHTPVKNLYDIINDFGEIIQAKTNANGNKIVFTLAGANLIPDGKLYVWDIETDTLLTYDFKKYSNLIDDDNDNDEEIDEKINVENEFNEICINRIPLSVNWDENDGRLLVCDAKKLKIPNDKKGFARSASEDDKKTLKDEDHIIVTMFISTEYGIKIHDIRAIDSEIRFLAVSTPYIVLLHKSQIQREIMNDFIGLENCDKITRDAVLDFSYNLTQGNMDAAFKAIKLVQSSGVWNSLAKMCVKTRRLDVAGVCLGHMGDAKAARALRLAINDQTLPIEAKVAVLAVHLGMLACI